MHATASRAVSAEAPLDQLILAVERDLLLANFATFTKAAWHVAEPGQPLRWGWHLDAIAEHLQAVTNGHIRNLLINIPPRHTKSLMTSVFWPAWEWAHTPQTAWLFASYAQTLATRDSVKMRRLLESTWYRQLFNVKLQADQNQKTRYDTTAGGYRISTSVGGAATGEGGQRRVIDDPHSAKEVHSDAKREAALVWFAETWSSRQVDPQTDTDVVIMQRLHERDLSGYLLEDVGGFEHLMLPARYEPARASTTRLPWADPRSTPGELLSPERFPEPELERLEHRLGEYGAAGQLQQRPAPAGGGIFKVWWWRYWQPRGADLGPVRVIGPDGQHTLIDPEEKPDHTPDQMIQSWDLAFKGGEGTSRVAGGVYEQHGASVYILDLDEKRRSFTSTVNAIRAMRDKHPNAYKIIVEDKANGPAVIDTLRHEIGGLIPSQPHGTKEARAHAVSPRIESGNVLLPHPRLLPWVESARAALSTFPATDRTDVVDQLTQALKYLPDTANAYTEGRTKARSVRRSR